VFDNPADLIEKIRLGEDSYLELKEVRFAGNRVTAPHRHSLADELAAFANSRGGVCVLGVDDSREVLGIALDRLNAVEDLVREVCLSVITPPLAPVIERQRLPSSTGEMVAILKVDVPRSLFVHKSPGGYLHRVGSAKREMTPDYLARLFQQRSQVRIIRFDEQPIPGAVLDDLSLELWQRFASPRGKDRREVLLEKLAMARPDTDGAVRPTIAGVLMASPNPRRWLPNALTVMTVETPQIMKVMTVSPSTCSAHSGLHAGIVRRAGSMLPEFPVSPPTLLPRGEKGAS
jgi:ATP-dependent DNA helicase RecG